MVASCAPWGIDRMRSVLKTMARMPRKDCGDKGAGNSVTTPSAVLRSVLRAFGFPGGCGAMELIPGSVRAAQAQTSEAQDALEMGQQHLNLLPPMTDQASGIGSGEGVDPVAGRFLRVAGDLAGRDLPARIQRTAHPAPPAAIQSCQHPLVITTDGEAMPDPAGNVVFQYNGQQAVVLNAAQTPRENGPKVVHPPAQRAS